jgi:hypothetical protein
MWLQTITDDKGTTNSDLRNDTCLPDNTMHFNALFDNNNIVPGVRAATDPDHRVISLSEANMSKVFNRVNTHKA